MWESPWAWGWGWDLCHCTKGCFPSFQNFPGLPDGKTRHFAALDWINPLKPHLHCRTFPKWWSPRNPISQTLTKTVRKRKFFDLNSNQITWTWWQLALTAKAACRTSSNAFLLWPSPSFWFKSITQTASIRNLLGVRPAVAPDVSLLRSDPTLSVIFWPWNSIQFNSAYFDCVWFCSMREIATGFYCFFLRQQVSPAQCPWTCVLIKRGIQTIDWQRHLLTPLTSFLNFSWIFLYF